MIDFEALRKELRDQSLHHNLPSAVSMFRSNASAAASSAGAMCGIAATRPPPRLAWPFSSRCASIYRDGEYTVTSMLAESSAGPARCGLLDLLLCGLPGFLDFLLQHVSGQLGILLKALHDLGSKLVDRDCPAHRRHLSVRMAWNFRLFFRKPISSMLVMS